MTIHERIKARRRECGLSVDEIASKLGVSRATVYRYESAEITNMGVDKIEPLSRVLHTTPEYLMGWTDDPIDYNDPNLIASISSQYLEACNGDVKKAYKMMQAVDEDHLAEFLHKEKTPALTEKDERDVAKDVKKIMGDLENSGDLMFDGVPMSEEAKAAMAAAMRIGLEEAKRRNKATYTPKKYRKG